MEPLYVRSNLSSTCRDRQQYASGFCKASLTNARVNVEVDFVVFPLTVAHVQASLAFAKKHRLCVTLAVSLVHENTQCDLDALRDALDPDMPRLLENPADGPAVMTPMAPLEGLSDEENAQPLYGLGLQQMEPLYVRSNLSSTCRDRQQYASGFCKASLTNARVNVEVDFVVFPLTVAHVQASLAFAKKHRLCVTLAGTGHEFYGRNQPLHCNGGSILIRPLLMKSKEADLADAAGLGHPSFVCGAGNVFSELQSFAASHDRLVASGNCPTVGLVGWALGGGHGPFAPWLGLGADQVLAVDIVRASGKHVRATANNKYSDLFGALRGGGGGTWGIVTHLVLKAHDLPELSAYNGVFMAPIVDEEAWKTFVNETVMFTGRLSNNATTRMYFLVGGGVFQGIVTGTQRGTADTVQSQEFLAMLARAGAQVATVTPRLSTDGYEAVPHPLYTTNTGEAVNSALLYKDTDLSVSKELRTATGMYVSVQPQAEIEEALGSGRTYYSESNGDLPMSRYWDSPTYWKLWLVKRKYDPFHIFGCRRCVGDDTYFSV
ncbi:hypothetical protein DIPPA_09121 [Diplonema papillatum]|nr:hypothetical protein DIPPA_09121 [Diplonema papillatum]